MSTAWVTQQILAIKRVAEPTTFNPRPAGVMLDHSATRACMDWLGSRQAHGWWTRHQIIVGTGRTQKSVDWALMYLRAMGLVEIKPHESHARYFRYRAVR